jgi:glucose/arabinose dehydrogenase
MIKRISFLLTLALFIGLLSYVLGARPAMAVTLPDGFEHRLLTSTPNPTALAFTPDGRLLIATKTGQLRVYKDGEQSIALDIVNRTCSNSERGLSGVTVDPDFGIGTNRYVYLYYTAKIGPTCEGSRNDVNRVSRFILSDDNTIDAASERKLIDNIPSVGGIHNAGDLHFGKDGYLYISVGDGGCDYQNPSNCGYFNDAARDRNILLGKILRIERDGGIPPNNPFTDVQSARCNVDGRTTAENCQETFAMGLRNPFRMAFDPDAVDTRFRINDVGGQHWEEINAGLAGADYGWNGREGHCAAIRNGTTDCGSPPPGMTNPIHDYSHSTGCEAITGGAFVPDGSFSPDYDNAYLFGDYVCNKIFKLTPKAGGSFARSVFASNLGPGGPIAMTFGRHGAREALYYTTFDGGGQEGTTPTLDWEILRHHDGNHTHPWFSGTGNNLTFTAPAPEDLLSTAPKKNYLEIRLTATDSLGLSTTRILALRPKTVDITFATQPTGFKLEVNGIPFRSPRTFRSWEGYKLNIYAPRQRHNGRTWVFLSWSDGRAARHTITTPATPTTYVATFKRVRR